MTRTIKTNRRIGLLLFLLFAVFSTPTPMADAAAGETVPHSSVRGAEFHTSIQSRTPPKMSTFSVIAVFAAVLPFVVPILPPKLPFRLPSPRDTLSGSIFLLLRRIRLFPLKFTSTYVS